MSYFMGIDVGTSSVKSLIMDESGNVLGIAQQKYDVLKPKLNYAEQDADALWEAARQTLLELSARFPRETSQLGAISYSGQMHGLVMVDSNCRPIRNAIIWQDQRSVDQIQKIYSLIPPDQFNHVTLNNLSTGYLVTSLMWVKEHEPRNYERTALILLPKDYIRYKMCGTLGTDVSDASSTVIFDTAGRTWPWEIIERLGLRRDLFPECHESRELAGATTRECAAQTGLPQGIPITYGGGDTLMHEIGTGLIASDRPWVSNIGTSCQVTCVAESPLYDRDFRTNTFCCAKENLWMLMSVGMCGGAAMKWISGILELTSFEELNRLAAQVRPGSDGLIFLPHLCGSRSPDNDPRAKGIFFGMTLDHSRAHFVRSTMEGVVYNLKSAMQLLMSITNREPEIMVASGGGARGELFRQMQADAFGKPIYTTMQAEQSCIGAAITAAVGIGYFSSFEEACSSAVKFSSEIVEPNQENSRVYQEYFELYQELYTHNKDLFARSCEVAKA